jgi:hypothetical protein
MKLITYGINFCVLDNLENDTDKVELNHFMPTELTILTK